MLWFLLSGHTEPFILTLGGISVLLVAILSYRMGVLDREAFPVHLLGRAPLYWLWLLKEILKANLDVARRIISPSMSIQPVEIVVPHRLKTDLGRCAYANSITLTPGTVATGVDEKNIRVHALSQAGVEDLKTNAMHDRVKRLEDSA